MSVHSNSLLSPALWAVLLPLAAACLSLLYGRLPRRGRFLLLGTAPVASALFAAILVRGVLAGSSHEIRLVRLMPDVYLSLRVDAAGALFGLSVAVLWSFIFVFSVGYLRDDRYAGRYHTFSMLCLAGLMGVAYAGDLITFLAFYELFSIMSYALIVHEGTSSAIAAARKYIVYIAAGGSLLVMGGALAFSASGAADFAAGGVLGPGTPPTTATGAALLLIAGFGVKAALFPLHGWVADAHPAAPAPFSAALSGVMVAAGTFGIVRVVYEVVGARWLAVLAIDRGLAAVAAFTAISAAVVAIKQDDLKRRLAYSTVSQMAYITLGASLLAPGPLTGALVHITNHASMKGCLFLCAGLLARNAGITRVSQMGGIARRFPVTMAAFTLSALALIGIPPLAGFVSKWVLGYGMLDAGAGGYLVVLLGGAALAAVYLLPVVRIAYLGEPSEEREGSLAPARPGNEAAPSMLAPIVALTAITALLGIAAFADGSALSLARLAAESLAGSR